MPEQKQTVLSEITHTKALWGILMMDTVVWQIAFCIANYHTNM